MTVEYAFYIDGKGRRKRSSFLIEWEGQPDSFAFSYPYVLAFEPNFIEIRHMLTVSKCALNLVEFVAIGPNNHDRGHWNKLSQASISNPYHRP